MKTEGLISYDFICTNNPKMTFTLHIDESQDDFNDLNWLLKVAEETARSKGAAFKFDGTLYVDNWCLLNKMDQPISYYSDLTPFYYRDVEEFRYRGFYKHKGYITLKDDYGNFRDISYEPDDTINEVETKIYKTIRNCEIQFCLILRSGYMIINDKYDKSFDSSIPNGEFVIINRPVSGGGSDCAFANMEDSGCIETHHFKASAPDWRYATSGLKIEGVCKNSSCKAYKKQVICKNGYGAFDLILDKGGCKCPICKILIDPITCGFTNCYYNWTGRKKNYSTMLSQNGQTTVN